MTITIRHTAAEGTVLDGLTKPETRRGTEVRTALDVNRWTWRPQPGWFQRQSRDQPPRLARIQDTARRLEALGYTVELHLDTTPRDMATREAEREERMDHRAERLNRRADRYIADGTARQERADEFFQAIPLGQPIIGRADRNRREKQLARWGRGLELKHHGERVAAKAASAEQHMDHRYAPRAVTSRIDRLETEARKLRLYLNEGTWYPHLDEQGRKRNRQPITDPAHRKRLEDQLADVNLQLDHWRAVHEQHLTEGRIRRGYGPNNVAKGQQVLVNRQWREVVRVNRKSVSVVDVEMTRYSGQRRTYPVPYDRVAGVRPAPAESDADQDVHGMDEYRRRDVRNGWTG